MGLRKAEGEDIALKGAKLVLGGEENLTSFMYKAQIYIHYTNLESISC